MIYSISRIIFLGIFFLSISFIKSDRKIDIFRNPNCEKFNCDNKGINIVYVKASSTSDVLHYIYAGGNFTDTLSVILIRSGDLNSSLSINYDSLINGSKNSIIKLSSANYSAFGLIFTKLYEYDDTSDNVKMNSDKWISRSFNHFTWNVTSDNTSITFFTKEFNQLNDKLLTKGSITIKFHLSGTKKNSLDKPNLLFSGDNTQADVILDNLVRNYSSSRFAVEVALINKLNIEGMYIKEDRTIDDEHSPGVFRIKNFFGQSSNYGNVNHTTYLQWKPVCYLDAIDHSLNKLSVATNFDIAMVNSSIDIAPVIRSSAAYMFFGNMILSPTSSTRMVNVTFGIAGDKLAPSKYTIWTLSFGVGFPPSDTISATVILIISFGLGLPFILVVVGSVYLIIKKRMNKRISYESIEDPIN